MVYEHQREFLLTCHYAYDVPFVVLGSMYKRLEYHRDKSITNPERSVTAKSLAECALYCQNTKTCHSLGKVNFSPRIVIQESVTSMSMAAFTSIQFSRIKLQNLNLMFPCYMA